MTEDDTVYIAVPTEIVRARETAEFAAMRYLEDLRYSMDNHLDDVHDPTKIYHALALLEARWRK